MRDLCLFPRDRNYTTVGKIRVFLSFGVLAHLGVSVSISIGPPNVRSYSVTGEERTRLFTGIVNPFKNVKDT